MDKIFLVVWVLLNGEDMQNSGGFGGSRSEFLPGEGYDDSDIKYQRYGGCFVSHKKGLVYVLLTVCAIIVASGLVYFYAPRFKDRQVRIFHS